MRNRRVYPEVTPILIRAHGALYLATLEKKDFIASKDVQPFAKEVGLECVQLRLLHNLSTLGYAKERGRAYKFVRPIPGHLVLEGATA